MAMGATFKELNIVSRPLVSDKDFLERLQPARDEAKADGREVIVVYYPSLKKELEAQSINFEQHVSKNCATWVLLWATLTKVKASITQDWDRWSGEWLERGASRATSTRRSSTGDNVSEGWVKADTQSLQLQKCPLPLGGSRSLPLLPSRSRRQLRRRAPNGWSAVVVPPQARHLVLRRYSPTSCRPPIPRVTPSLHLKPLRPPSSRQCRRPNLR